MVNRISNAGLSSPFSIVCLSVGVCVCVRLCACTCLNPNNDDDDGDDGDAVDCCMISIFFVVDFCERMYRFG